MSGLLGEGIDKERFLIFDFCNNFEYFRVNKGGSESGIQETVCEKIYNTKVQIARELQGHSILLMKSIHLIGRNLWKNCSMQS